MEKNPTTETNRFSMQNILKKTFTFLQADRKGVMPNAGTRLMDRLILEYPPLSPEESLRPETDVHIQVWPPLKKEQ